MRVRLFFVVSGLLAVLCITSASTLTAATASTSTADQVVSEITDVAGTSDVIPASQTTADSDSAAVASTGGATVDVPKDPSAGIDVTTSDGTTISIGIANDDSARDAKTTASGTTVYNDPTTSSAVAVQIMTDGVRELFTLNNADAPKDFSVPLNLPADASLIANDEGGYDIVTPNADGTASTQATISAPWATDANGTSLTTSYTLDGTTLTQHIDTIGAVYPVVADPKVVWNWTNVTVYFSARETKNIAYGGTIATWIKNPYISVAGKLLITWAGFAIANDKCVYIRINYWGYTSGAGIYRNSYCKYQDRPTGPVM
jgi:hypothetical protein